MSKACSNILPGNIQKMFISREGNYDTRTKFFNIPLCIPLIKACASQFVGYPSRSMWKLNEQ